MQIRETNFFTQLGTQIGTVAGKVLEGILTQLKFHEGGMEENH